MSRRRPLPRSVKEVDGGADQDQGRPEGGVDDGVFALGDGLLIVGDVIEDREGEIEN